MNKQLHIDPGAPRILIAEDSPTQAAQIIQLLTRRGYTVQAARNGEEAYDLALLQRPDIIISDIVMPGIDGYELCRRLKSTPGHEDTPVVLVTSLSQPQDVLAGLEAGADNFIIKPYNEDILSARINYLLMNKSLRRAERASEQLEVEFGGERHQITARKQQILDLLISTYAQAVHLVSALDQGRQELSQSYEVLQALYEMSNGLNRCRTPAEVAAIAVSRCIGMPGVRSAWLYLRHEDRLELTAERHVARSSQIDPYAPDHGDHPSIAPADADGHVVLRANGGGGIRHHASLKLQVGSQIMGYLNIVGTEPTVGGEVAPQTLGAIASQLSIALERAILHTGLEAEVQRRTHLLTQEIEERRQATETISAIFNASPVALVSLDSQLNVAGWNRTATEVFRTPPETVTGQCWSSLFVSEPAALDRALSALQRGTEFASIEVNARLHDNTPRSLHVAGEPLIDGGGIFRGAVLAIDDITDMKQVKERLHQAQKMEAVGNLTGGIAHDFNNLLTTIIGNLDLAMMSASNDQRPALDTALRASLRGSELTKKLLAFARKQSLEPQVVDPVDILEEVGLLLAGRMASRINMSISVAPDIAHIYADPTELETALINLAINARDAMPNGGALNIAAAYVPPDAVMSGSRAYVEFTVSDTGVGIAPEKLDRIFEPFFTTKEPGKGTGLGLAMVYGFASQSGGYLTVDSEVDVGTVFRLGLPAVTETAGMALAGARAPDVLTSNPLRVLLLAQDCDVCRLVETTLGPAGHEILVADTQEQMRTHLDTAPQIDLLMVDIEIEGLANLALVRTMMATGACRRALILAKSRPEAEIIAGSLDSCAILIKPFRVQELNDAIATLF